MNIEDKKIEKFIDELLYYIFGESSIKEICDGYDITLSCWFRKDIKKMIKKYLFTFNGYNKNLVKIIRETYEYTRFTG